MSKVRQILRAIWVAALCAGPGVWVSAQEPGERGGNVLIKETRWGFDGTAVRSRFTPLSVLIQNSGAGPAAGTLRLERLAGPSRVDVPVETTFDIPPFEERWFQLTPWLSDGYDQWLLRWSDNPRDSLPLAAPRLAGPATVLLNNPNELTLGLGTVRRFSVELFPVSVTGTDCLETVLLDSVPDLRGARLQAFRDWLHRGGRVVLLWDSQLRHPRFPEALSLLNNPAESFSAGAGLVRRLPIRASEIDAEQLRSIRGEATQRIARNRQTGSSTQQIWDRDRAILSDLEATSRFTRRWWLIYPLALLYLGAIFPVSYLVGRQARYVRWFYSVYFGAVLVFSIVFTLLGRVGVNEQNRVRTATIARSLGGALYDVTQWISLAPVIGDSFEITHPGSGRLYASGEEFESVLGKAVAGTDARLELDIPPASTRRALGRFRAEGPVLQIAVLNTRESEGRLEEFTVECSPFPDALRSAFVAHRDHLYSLDDSGGVLRLDRLKVRRTLDYVTEVDLSQLNFRPFFGLFGSTSRNDKTTEHLFALMERRLIGNAFATSDVLTDGMATLPTGTAKLLLLTDHEAGFEIASDRFPDHAGRVLYVFELTLPAAASP